MTNDSFNIVAFGFDQNFTQAIESDVPTVSFVDKNIHEVEKSTLEDVEVALVFVFSKVRRDVLDAMPNLKAVITLSAGTDHIDKEYCDEQNIEVHSTPGYGNRTVAEQAFALLLSFERHIVPLQKENQLDFSREPYYSRQLGGKTIGIVGTGKIGLAAARIAQGFGMNILGYDVHHNKEFEEVGRYASLNQIADQCDYVSLHVPLLPATRNLWDTNRIAAMKDDAVIINTCRAGVLDEQAMLQALQDEKLRGAVLDVYEEEQYPTYVERDDVLVTPHNAFYTKHALQKMVRMTVEDIEEL